MDSSHSSPQSFPHLETGLMSIRVQSISSGMIRNTSRAQRTIERLVETRGVGFLTGQTIRIRFAPAEENSGILFQRLDLPGKPLIPAGIAQVVHGNRHTLIEHQGAQVALTEHVMAALAGLQIDNCLVQLDGPEVPGCDGSALEFVRCLQRAEIVQQQAAVNPLMISHEIHLIDQQRQASLTAFPTNSQNLILEYHLDYGSESPIPAQSANFVITPESFSEHIAASRTFILEHEIAMLKSRGYGQNTTFKDLLVFGSNGLIDNQLRSENECARHKLLDAIGDFALLSRPLVGHIIARKTGHEHNHNFLKLLLQKVDIPQTRAA